MATIIMLGPTGVGKTELAEQLATTIDGAIINADSAQFYKPLTIGTAKPDYQKSAIEHYCFDIIDEPVNYSVAAYREQVQALLSQLYKRNKVPIMVGGSGFYVKSLLYPPCAEDMSEEDLSRRMPSLAVSAIALCDGGTSVGGPVLRSLGEGGWEQLHAIDPVRAAQIHPHDSYRIKRALAIWEQTGKKPSECKPVFNPIDDMLIVFVTREREQLYERINERVTQMMDAGWMEEVKALPEAWTAWLIEKKIIGYDTIIDFIVRGEKDKKELVEQIQRKTRNYAKGQVIFWKSFKRQLAESLKNYTGNRQIMVMELSLTLPTHDLYINQLLAWYTQLTNMVKNKQITDKRTS